MSDKICKLRLKNGFSLLHQSLTKLHIYLVVHIVSDDESCKPISTTSSCLIVAIDVKVSHSGYVKKGIIRSFVLQDAVDVTAAIMQYGYISRVKYIGPQVTITEFSVFLLGPSIDDGEISSKDLTYFTELVEKFLNKMIPNANTTSVQVTHYEQAVETNLIRRCR